MERELERCLSSVNRDRLFASLMKTNPIELPNVMIDKEIEHLKHEIFHRVFGHQHRDDEEIPDFPRELFADEAKKQVLSNLF